MIINFIYIFNLREVHLSFLQAVPDGMGQTGNR